LRPCVPRLVRHRSPPQSRTNLAPQAGVLYWE
jgi:hypothetical protein